MDEKYTGIEISGNFPPAFKKALEDVSWCDEPVKDANYWERRAKAEPVNGIIVFYVHVGQLSPSKAEAYVERFKEQIMTPSFKERVMKNHEVMFIPRRTGRTTVEYMPFNY